MINVKHYPLSESLVERLNQKFHNGGWVTLCDERIFSCLVPDAIVDECLTRDSWEMKHYETGPVINEHSDGTFISYLRHDKQNIEPIVIYLEKEGRWPEQVLLSEEFVMFFRLHKKLESTDRYVYYQVDECGDDVEVARINHLNVTVRLKYVKEYIAVKKVNLLIFDDELIYHEKSLTELGLSPIPMALNKGNDYVFSYSLNDAIGFGLEYKTCAVFQGKCVFRHNDNDIKHLWKLRDDGYEEFIVGADKDGNELMMSSDESKMPNLFNRKDDEPILYRRFSSKGKY